MTTYKMSKIFANHLSYKGNIQNAKNIYNSTTKRPAT